MADITISTIQFKRGTKANLEAALVGTNIPAAGEPIWETDTNKLKIGDGVTAYVSLPYLAGGGTVEEQIIFSNIYEFPSVGTVNKLYIAKDQNKAYLWDTSVPGNSHYEPVGVEGKIIDGGGASSF